ncbi:MAG: hypothetical protein RLN84_07485 [Rhodospirillaceae bacterium]
MFRFLLMTIVFVTVATPLTAQENENDFTLGGDRFLAGTTPVHDAVGVDDLFMAGETVRSKQAITGSAHLAGRKVIMTGAVGGDAYVAGMDVTLDGPVAGDATVSGYNVQVSDVAGDLRVAGTNIIISGPVSGYALVAGDDVRFESVITGDVRLVAQDVDFVEGARIQGTLTIYEEDEGDVEVPESVVPEARIDRRQMSEWLEADTDLVELEGRSALTEFLSGVVIVTVLGIVIAAVAPAKLAELRRCIVERPFRTLWFGILAESVMVGSTVILILTVVGLVLAPATLAAALAIPFAGYVVAAYALGAGLLMAMGRSEPKSFGSRALAAGVGALAVGVIGAIPFIGWVCVLGLSLAGVGSFALWLFRPKFYATA